MGVIQNAVSWAVGIANDDRHGYDQNNRWGPDYDCSSLVISAYKHAGVPLTCTYTGDMLNDMLSHGFRSIGLTAEKRIGDVLLAVAGGHTAIYIGNNQLVQASISENGTVHAGQVGDQTGAEILVRSYYNFPWEYVLRYNESVPGPGAMGIDTAFSNVINTSTVSRIDFGIPRIGSFGYGQTGTTAYYNKALNVDAGFLSSVNNLLSAGKYAGCYIFSYAWDTVSAIAEADRVCDYLDSHGINLNLPVFFDWERTGAGTYGSYEMVTAAGITVTDQLIQNMTLAFMQRVSSRGRRAGWYQGAADLADWFSTDLVQQYRNSGYYLWYAKWTSTFDGYACDCWQYAGDTSFNGVACDLDKAITDRFFGGAPGPGPGPSRFPLWLLFKISQNNTLKRRFPQK